jgi:hypothetical protein
MASSSQTASPPPQQDTGYAQILEALASLQGGYELYAAGDFIIAIGLYFYAA